VVRAAQFARILVLDISRRFQRVAERRMPRREGDVLRLGTATMELPIQKRAVKARNEKARLLHAIEPKRQPPTGAFRPIRGSQTWRRPCLARLTIGPQDELERLVIGLAGVERRLNHSDTLRVVGARAPARHKAWRNITTSCWLHWSKCPSHNCSLMSCVSSPIAARLWAGVLRSNEQLTCRDSISGSQVNATS